MYIVIIVKHQGFNTGFSPTYFYKTNVLEKDGFVTWTKVPGATSYIVVVTTGDVSNTYKLGDVNSLSVKEYTGEITVSVTPVSNGYNSPEATLYTFTIPVNYLAAAAFASLIFSVSIGTILFKSPTIP